MRKSLILLLLLFLLFNNVVLAITVSPHLMNETAEFDIVKTINFTITNDNDYDYYNLTFSSKYNISSIPFLSQTNTTNHTFEVTTNEVNPETEIITVSYIKKQQITADPKTYNIILNDAGFTPYNITIRPQDTLIFNNTDVINHTVTELNDEFDYVVRNNSILQLQFDAEKQMYDKVNSQTFKVFLNSTFEDVYVHNSEQDYLFYLTLNSTIPRTNISAIVLEQDKEVYGNETISGKVIIQTSNNPAYDIFLEGERFVFGKQMFNITANNAEIVFFNYTNNIKNTIDTNQSHNYSVTISGLNFDELVFNYTVFIKYELLNNSIDPISEFCMLEYDELTTDADKRQYLIFCEGEKLSEKETITKEVIKEVILDFGVSAEDIKTNNEKIDEQSERITGLENTFNQRVPDLAAPLEEIEKKYQELNLKMNDQFTILNTTLISALEEYKEIINEYDLEKEKKKTKTIWFWVLGFIIVLGGGGFIIARYTGHASTNTQE